MVDARRFSLTPQLDIQQILIEAKIRWLRPSEICEILRNYQRFSLTPDPPYQPSGGSLFLFDRKALRYFRKDGHRWRKKKDGKTVREAHEKLKSGSVDVLHCYYAHGEDNENFQRRSYWMLDGQLEHIVLVHYRDVTEGSRSSVSHLSNTNPETTDNPHGALSGSAVCSTHLGSAFDARAGNGSSPSTVPTPSSEFDDADSGGDFGGASFTDSMPYSRFQIASLRGHDTVETNVGGCTTFSHPCKSGMSDSSLDRSFSPFFVNQVAPQNRLLSGEQQKIRGSAQPSGSFGASCFTQHNTTTTWPEVLCLNQKFTEWQEQNISFERTNCGEARTITRRIGDSLPADHGVRECDIDAGSSLLIDTYPPSFSRDESTLLQVKEESSMNVHSPYSDSGMEDNSIGSYEVLNKNRLYTSQEPEVSCAAKNALRSNALIQELGELKKLDSFGRWMDKEIGKDCDDSLMGSDSCNYWPSLNTSSVEKDVSSLSRHMQLDSGSLGPSLSQEQLFSVLDFSPDWAYSGIGTKLLITGTFLGDVEPNTIKWGCMFGEQEVSAEVLTTKVIRCEAPIHTPGRVPFYVTCSNRLACSEVREFEYRENNSGELFSLSPKSEPEEVQLQVRFAKMLSLRADTKKLICYVRNCQKCLLKKSFFSLLSDGAHEWDKIEKDSKVFRGHHINHRNRLLEKTLQEMLYHWLVRKVHEEGKGPHTFDEEGQGAIHLAAGLGYQWAMGPIVASGVHPSFRDARGRTALHWAACFGREETVVALVKLGAAPGAVEDPTPTFPGETTAADLASDRGHKGIAGYLAEAALTSHLSSLTLRESMLESALVTADKAVETIKVQNNFCLDGEKADQLSLRGSLAAMRNSALAAAQIQFAFRSHSFRQRQSRGGICENNDICDNALVLSSLRNKAQKNSHFSDSLNVSALKIQRKYRGWKAHKEFLKFRDRIVKIQAHVRGHQVRKQYKKVVWSVSIVEKAILRWRRKRSGLRGFRSEKAGVVEQEIGETDEYEFLRLGRKQKVAAVEKALGRVQSMVRSPEARDQYMRLVAISGEPQMAENEDTYPKVEHAENVAKEEVLLS